MKKSGNHRELSPKELRWECDPKLLKFKTTEEVKVFHNIIGQERAIKAIRLGLELDAPGYNIFVTGLAGTGRRTTIKSLLEEIDKSKKTPQDKICVNNFKNPDMPRIIKLPAGDGRRFKKDMEKLISELKKEIPRLFESENYQKRRTEIVEKLREKEKKMARKLEEKVRAEGFALVEIQMGPFVRHDVAPIIKGKPINIEQLEQMVIKGEAPREEYDKAKEKRKKLLAELEELYKTTKKIEKEIKERLAKLDQELAEPYIDEPLSELKERYENEKLHQYLDEAKESLLENLKLFLVEKKAPSSPFPGLEKSPAATMDLFLDYRVNLLVDNYEAKGAPVVIENNPSYKNLFGTIERVPDQRGAWHTDFTKIKAGSLLKADGGYLILNAIDVLIEPGVWVALKRTLKSGVLEIQSYDPLFLLGHSALKPEPVEIDVKVVMIGDDRLYRILYIFEDDFKKIFKVKADFDTVMENTEENIIATCSFIKKTCEEEKLLHFDRSAVAKVIEYGVRLAGRKNKISTEFSKLVDLLREASYWAKKEGAKYVTASHIEKALEEKIHRVNMIEDKIKELIREGTIMIDIEGEKVGQVNGLSVIQLGDHTFGKPSKITAEVSLGKLGVINIEREAALSGKTHDKGVLILSGYLRGKYAQDKPLSMSASLCFEQSYSGIDGDSASSTELYAILSSLANLPLRQDIAVTGSVNQKGEIQPIGGVNEKIEGFFDICKAKGLTGTQGVIIPELNVPDLMLRDDIVKAVAEGKFHIYPVKTVDEGIEILTGVKAGKKKKDGTYEEETVHYLVNKRLEELASKLTEFEVGEEEKP